MSKRPRSALSRTIAAVTLVTLVNGSCGNPNRAAPQPGGGSGSNGPGDFALQQDADTPDGLDLRLSDGRKGPDAFDRSKLVPAVKLGAPDTQALLGQLPAIGAQADDKQTFAFRPKSAPPPRTGETLKQSFPPPPSSLLPPVTNDVGRDLEVLRWAPEGDVPLAPELTLTFSQPMVAVTSQDDARAIQPASLSPLPAGRWRWLGTKTLLFDPDVRFPQATTYTVEVPAGTKSATGNVLKSAKKFTFTTPTPTVVHHYPSGSPQRRDVPMFVMFDQKIDAAAVLATIKVSDGKRAYQTQLLDAVAIAADKQLTALVEQATRNEQVGRWLAFRATEQFPTDTQISIDIGPGTPSAEGPNKTKSGQAFGFRTYAPLRVEEARCGWGECRPGTPFQFEFNNPIDSERFEPTLVTVTPDVPGMRIEQQGNWINAFGATKANTTYRVTVAGSITDDFGQTLGKDYSTTFRVGDPYPNLYGPQGMVVVDPIAKTPTLDVYSTTYDALKVKLYQVTVEDYAAFGNFMREQWNRDKPPRMPGKLMFDKSVKVQGKRDELIETKIDLLPALAKSGRGHVVAVIEPSPWREQHDPPRLYTWVQVSQIAVDASVDGEQLVAFTTRLADGKVAGGVDLELRPSKQTGKSDSQGIASLPLPASGKGAGFLIARQGDDVAFVTDDNGWWNEYSSWARNRVSPDIHWYVTDDRSMYKPGEDVKIKGLLRLVGRGLGGDVSGLMGRVTDIAYEVFDGVGNKIGTGTTKVSPAGSFDLGFTLPKTPNLGYATVNLQTKGAINASFGHSFQIQEFRRPEYEVTANASQGPHLVGAGGDVTVAAKYFAGGGLPGAQVSWQVNASETQYTPPNRDEFIFGRWQPWWGWRAWWDDSAGYQPARSWAHEGKTDAIGEHTLHLDFLSAKPSLPMTVSASATVYDVNRQGWATNATMLVHPAERYVGLKTAKPFVEKGQPIKIEVIGVDLDGKATPGASIEVRAARQDWEWVRGKYIAKEVDIQTCQVTAADAPVLCELPTKDGGVYEVSALIRDAKGRANLTEMTVWVTGGDMPPKRDVEKEEVNLIPDKKEYKAGDVAELLVQAPFSPAEGVVTIRRGGIVKVERITLTGPTTSLKIPIVEAYTPNVIVHVELVGAAVRLNEAGEPEPKLPKRPAFAGGEINLPVPPYTRTLKVEVGPNAAKVAPGAQATFNVVVKDAGGRPVPGAEVALIVVDEAVLSLTGKQFADPINTFYFQRGGDTRDHAMRGMVKLAQPNGDLLGQAGSGAGGGGRMAMSDAVAASPTVAMAESAPGGPPPPAPPPPPEALKKNAPTDQEEDGRDGKPAGNKPVALRTNFNPLAAFSPTLATGTDGRATLTVKIPDNLTRYRVIAIANARDKEFGKGESAITARLPIMVRPSPPRFLNFGDVLQLPVVVQNQTDGALKVKVGVRATNANLTDGGAREVTVPANDRVEVLFPAAAEMAGTARFQFIAVAGNDRDAAELALPVWTPATTEAFATYGVIDNGAIKQPVALPGAVVTQFGGLEVTTSSTQLQALTDAFLYLVSYPFECAEQRASRILSIAALRDVLTAFDVEGMPKPAEIEARVTADLERLSNLQNGDGGFPFWQRGYESWPYLTVHVTNALVRAKAKGYSVPAAMLTRAMNYLKNIERHYPHYYSEEVRRAISAYALFVRKLGGDVDAAKALALLSKAGGPTGMTMEANGWLLGTLTGQASAADERKTLVRHFMNKVSETAGAANFTNSYKDGAHLLLGSDRRVDGVILEALIAEQPANDLIPKLVTGLLAHKKRGRWSNTQDNVFVLTALDLYFRTFEKITPDFVARVWLGDQYAGDHTFKGRQTDYAQIDIPMKHVAAMGKGDLVVQKDGKGRLYYRIGMTYAPADLKLQAADYGFAVERRYEAVDDPGDVTRLPDGTWKFKAGAKVRVRLKMVAENRRYHVALVDPMPAGLEAMNPALAVTGPIPQDPSEQKNRGPYWWWASTWYEHQNMRDERVEAFASLLWEGVHSYTYVGRATTPGNFVVPPARAEEMYMPETFGRSASDRVIIE